MRKFSESEKETIRIMVNISSGNFTCSLFPMFKDIFFDHNFYYEAGPQHLYYDSSKMDRPELIEKEKLLVDLALLLKYLADNRYIYVFRQYPLYTGTYGMKTDSHKPIAWQPWLMEQFNYYITCYMYVSQDLYTLVDNDFKEYEELVLDEASKQTAEAKKQSKITLISAILSAVAVVTAIITIFIK